jgi:hypothetical protein
MFEPVFQSRLPVLPWMDPLAARLPGVQPTEPTQWLLRDEAYAGQMAWRDRLIAGKREAVFAATDGVDEAARELLAQVLVWATRDPGYARSGAMMVRPDGVAMDLHSDHPLLVAGRLVQEDLILLAPSGEGHVLAAGLVCFPASWTLAQKIGRPLPAIHIPVARYDKQLADRTERIIANLRIGEPVWRANVLAYTDPNLHHPLREGEQRFIDPEKPLLVRVERQTLLRLSRDSVVFAIHTALVPFDTLGAEEASALQQTAGWPKR